VPLRLFYLYIFIVYVSFVCVFRTVLSLSLFFDRIPFTSLNVIIVSCLSKFLFFYCPISFCHFYWSLLWFLVFIFSSVSISNFLLFVVGLNEKNKKKKKRLMISKRIRHQPKNSNVRPINLDAKKRYDLDWGGGSFWENLLKWAIITASGSLPAFYFINVI
jgi:hypothetical protein